MVGALILGLVAGFIGKALMPGKDPGGFIVTILLGLAGAAVGFLIFTELLGIYRAVVGRRSPAGARGRM